MKEEHYKQILAWQGNRRQFLQRTGATGTMAALASSGLLGVAGRAYGRATGDSYWQGKMSKVGQEALSKMSKDEIALRKKLVQIPGVGTGSPTAADWRKVGELCLGPTKARIQPNEFKGVKLTFMGLNNQGWHNNLFRGFLHSWEQYTGAQIDWIDLSQADYNAHLQRAIATDTIDFDILEMGAPYEGEVGSKGLMSEMPDWAKEQIDFEDLANYIKPPVGTWDGKLLRTSVDGDCHTLNYRSDYFASEKLAKAWKDEGHEGPWEVPRTWDKVNEVTKFLDGKQFNGRNAYGYLDAPKPWGGFGFYFLLDRASAYVKHPDDPAVLFDPKTMKPRINNPGFVRAIKEEIEALKHEPPNQINADPNTTGFSEFLGGTGSMVTWWGDVGQAVNTSSASVVGGKAGFDTLPGSDKVYNANAGKWEKLSSGRNYAPNCAYIGWGVYVMKRVESDSLKHKAAWSAAAHLGGKDLSLWTCMYPSGFQMYRKSNFIVPEYVNAGYDKGYIKDFLEANFASYESPNAIVEPRIPGIFQYYSLAEVELAKVFAGDVDAQTGADKIAASWEKLTDQLGRKKQIEQYQISLGMT